MITHGRIDPGIAKPHDRSFAKLLFDLPQCCCERFLFIVVHLLPTYAFELLNYHTVEREHKENFSDLS